MKSLVFVHGYLGGGKQWADQVETFSGHFRVITPDLPGFGENHAMSTPESIRELAIYVLNKLDELDAKRFHLVGHSMGGMIVQEMAALAPERIDKLVLYGTGPVGNMPGRFETIDESRRGVKEKGVEATGRRIVATWFQRGESADGYPVCAELAVKASLQAALAGLTAMENWSGESALSKITSSTLVLWGDGDRAYPWIQPEQLWRQIGGAQLGVIPGCSHAVHLEKPHLFNAMLLDFLGID
ncbi:MAG: alpha/beta hydrolase [Gammaproteobacteria bacterium]|nr:alpha/beta hydrolase [Gammaproteobacteria bacterium]MDH3449315.1 alpha/beta hydrolase [Gammaproteobacteria bacterium]